MLYLPAWPEIQFIQINIIWHFFFGSSGRHRVLQVRMQKPTFHALPKLHTKGELTTMASSSTVENQHRGYSIFCGGASIRCCFRLNREFISRISSWVRITRHVCVHDIWVFCFKAAQLKVVVIVGRCPHPHQKYEWPRSSNSSVVTVTQENNKSKLKISSVVSTKGKCVERGTKTYGEQILSCFWAGPSKVFFLWTLSNFARHFQICAVLAEESFWFIVRSGSKVKE